MPMAGSKWGDEPLLDIETLIERPKIRIDGELYEILSPDEISAVDAQRFGAEGRRIDALSGKDSLSDKERKDLTKMLRDISDRVMVGVPEEIREKLSDQHRLQVAEAFILLPLKDRRTRLAAAAGAFEGAAAGNQQPDAPTGANSQPDSSGSTAATPDGGSTKRRSRSSGRTSR